jgi:hypothetical protein
MRVENHDRELVWVVEFSTALSLALMTAFVFAIKSVNPSIQFAFGAGTVFAFLLSGFIFWWSCHVYMKKVVASAEGGMGASPDRKRLLLRWAVFFSAALVLETILAFAYALRGVPSEKLREVIEGTAWAILFLSMTGFLFWKLTRFVERDKPPPHLRDKEEKD